MEPAELTVAVVGERASEVTSLLRRELPTVRFLTATGDEEARSFIAQADALFTYGDGVPGGLTDHAPRLRWIQALTSGTDHLQWLFADRPDVLVTSAQGVHTAPVAELALLLMLGLARDFPAMQRQMAGRHWERLNTSLLLHGRVVGIAGLGAIGTAIARHARSFGMRTVGFGSAPRTVAEVDAFYGYDRLADIAPELDFLVVAAALTKRTQGLVDHRVIRALGPHAFLVNVGRGAIIDEAALIDALKAGRLGGAGLDAFVTEPLPPDSPFWTLPNVIVTPHTAGAHIDVVKDTVPLVVENTRHLIAGQAEKMRTIVQWPGA